MQFGMRSDAAASFELTPPPVRTPETTLLEASLMELRNRPFSTGSTTALPTSQSSPSNCTPLQLAFAESGGGAAADAMTHALVRRGKLYSVCYVPRRLRGSVAVGELVLVESGVGEGTGTIVADVSGVVARLLANPSSSPYLASLGTESAIAAALCPEEAAAPPTDEDGGSAMSSGVGAGSAMPPLYGCPVLSGLPDHDDALLRLPCVLRRGVNKDKKRAYYSRKRDAEALWLVNSTVAEKGWTGLLPIDDVSYQVDFHAITLFLRGGAEFYDGDPAAPQLRRRHGGGDGGDIVVVDSNTAGSVNALNIVNRSAGWSRPALRSAGKALAGPLRTDVVEFRCCHQFPELAHLTRRVLGTGSTALLERVLQAATDAAEGSANGAAATASKTVPAPLPPSLMRQSSAGGDTLWAAAQRSLNLDTMAAPLPTFTITQPPVTPPCQAAAPPLHSFMTPALYTSTTTASSAEGLGTSGRLAASGSFSALSFSPSHNPSSATNTSPMFVTPTATQPQAFQANLQQQQQFLQQQQQQQQQQASGSFTGFGSGNPIQLYAAQLQQQQQQQQQQPIHLYPSASPHGQPTYIYLHAPTNPQSSFSSSGETAPSDARVGVTGLAQQQTANAAALHSLMPGAILTPQGQQQQPQQQPQQQQQQIYYMVTGTPPTATVAFTQAMPAQDVGGDLAFPTLQILQQSLGASNSLSSTGVNHFYLHNP